jgi:hypothetical protein
MRDYLTTLPAHMFVSMLISLVIFSFMAPAVCLFKWAFDVGGSVLYLLPVVFTGVVFFSQTRFAHDEDMDMLFGVFTGKKLVPALRA